MLNRLKKISAKPGHLIIGIFLAASVAIVAGTFIVGSFMTEKPGAVPTAFFRVRNYITFAVLGDKPHFYYLEGEKNGKEIKLTDKDRFEVTYRDEFVFKGVATDDLFGGKTTVDVEETGAGNDLGRLLKGVELVDKTALAPAEKPVRILVRYNETVIAAIPVVVTVSAQDWLRYARATEDNAAKIRYLQKAIALNKEDIPVRRMLVASYEKAGMKEAAAAQLAEIQAMEGKAPVADGKPAVTPAMPGGAAEAPRPGGAASGSSPYVQSGLACSKKGDWNCAIANYQEALQQEPNNGQVRYKLGEAFEKSGRTGEAVRQYELVLAGSPKADYAMLALADVSLKSGQYDGAIKWYGELVKLRPREASLYGNLGLAYGGKGMGKEEIAQYRKALALNPKNTVVLFNLAAAYEKGKNDREAAKTYAQVLKIKPNDNDAQARLAGLAFKNGNYTEAIARYEKAIKNMNGKAAAYANLGFAYGEKKNFKKAVENYEKAIKSGNKDPQVRTNLASAKNELSGRKAVVEERTAAAEKAPVAEKSPAAEKVSAPAKTAVPAGKAPNRRIERYMKAKKYDLAIADYKALIRKSPKNASYYEGLGDVYGLKGDTNRQIESYQRSLKLGKASDGVYTRLGQAYEKKGRLKEALAAYSKAYELNPDSAAAGRRIPQLKIKMLQEKHRGEGEKEDDES